MSIDKDIAEIRKNFTILNSGDLIYLDSAATNLKPNSVVNRLSEFYTHETASVHRGAYKLSAQATQNFEEVRAKAQKFVGARSTDEIIFTSGTTASINLVANCLEKLVGFDDEILITDMEHHSNIVPWYLLAKKTGCKLISCAVTDTGEINLDDVKAKLSNKTKVFAFTMVSNVLGTINPALDLISLAKKKNIITVVDAAQMAAYGKIDVVKLDCDFLSISAHKMFGPFGVGLLYGKKEILTKLPPWQGGGGMINEVKLDEITFADLPFKFEAGTPNVSGVIAFGAAIDFINKIGFSQIESIEGKLNQKVMSELKQIKGVRIYGSAQDRIPIFSFNIEGAHASDVASVLDQMNVAVRAGHHCAQILMKRYGTGSMVRASLSIYNNFSDVEKFISALRKSKEILL